MKKYTSAILIPCLLLQLCGCWSNNYINIDQLDQYYPDKEIAIRTKDKREFIIKKDIPIDEIENNPDLLFCPDYKVLNDSLILFRKSIINKKDKIDSNLFNKVVRIDTIAINKSFIDEVGVREINKWTVAIIVSVAVLAAIISLLIWGIPMDTDMSDGK